MEISNIVVFLQADAASAPALGLAVALAAERGATLTAVCAFRDPRLEPADAFAIGPAGVGEVLADRAAAITRLLAPVETAFRAACAQAKVACDWTPSAAGEPVEDLALRARCFDLAVVAQPKSREEIGAGLAERVALTSGSPCLIAPSSDTAASPPFRRIVVAWNGSREAKHAVDAAMPFLKAASDVVLVTADGEPLEASMEAIVLHLGRHGVGARARLAEAPRGDAGVALLDSCAAAGADLLVMGAFGHSRAAEMILGGATRTVLAEASLPVLMAH